MDYKVKLIRNKPVQCPTCGQMEVWHINARQCDFCAMISYLEFRHAMNWPLDDADKRRLGLA